MSGEPNDELRTRASWDRGLQLPLNRRDMYSDSNSGTVKVPGTELHSVLTVATDSGHNAVVAAEDVEDESEVGRAGLDDDGGRCRLSRWASGSVPVITLPSRCRPVPVRANLDPYLLRLDRRLRIESL